MMSSSNPVVVLVSALSSVSVSVGMESLSEFSLADQPLGSEGEPTLGQHPIDSGTPEYNTGLPNECIPTHGTLAPLAISS